MKLLLLILLVPLLASMELVGASKKGSLRASLFSSYDKRVKPDEEVKVKFGVSVQGLNYCPKYEILTVRAWEMTMWEDPRLKWNPDDWNGIDRLRLPSEDLWLPDVTLYNSYGNTEANYVSWQSQTKIVLMSSGTIVFVPPVTYKSYCPRSGEGHSHANGQEQNCTLTLGSWTYDQSEVDVLAESFFPGHDVIELEYYVTKKIEIVSASVKRNERTYDCCPNEVYPTLDFSFVFKDNRRKYGDHSDEDDDSNSVEVD